MIKVVTSIRGNEINANIANIDNVTDTVKLFLNKATQNEVAVNSDNFSINYNGQISCSSVNFKPITSLVKESEFAVTVTDTANYTTTVSITDSLAKILLTDKNTLILLYRASNKLNIQRLSISRLVWEELNFIRNVFSTPTIEYEAIPFLSTTPKNRWTAFTQPLSTDIIEKIDDETMQIINDGSGLQYNLSIDINTLWNISGNDDTVIPVVAIRIMRNASTVTVSNIDKSSQVLFNFDIISVPMVYNTTSLLVSGKFIQGDKIQFLLSQPYETTAAIKYIKINIFPESL